MGADRRQFPRAPFFAEVTLTPLPGGPVLAARAYDIGLGGVGLAAPAALPVGQLVELAFRLPGGPGGEVLERLVGRVANARSDEAGASLGVEFLAPPSRLSAPALAAAIAGA